MLRVLLAVNRRWRSYEVTYLIRNSDTLLWLNTFPAQVSYCFKQHSFRDRIRSYTDECRLKHGSVSDGQWEGMPTYGPFECVILLHTPHKDICTIGVARCLYGLRCMLVLDSSLAPGFLCASNV